MKPKKLIIVLILLLVTINNFSLGQGSGSGGSSNEDPCANNLLPLPGFNKLFYGICLMGQWLNHLPLKILAVLVYLATFLVHQFFFFINNAILAPVVDFVVGLDPFEGMGNNSPVISLWSVLKNFAYIILVFSALAAAYEWLLGQEGGANRLIFNIIIVALLINFTFTLIKEAFGVVHSIELGLAGGFQKLGTLIAASLWQKDPFQEINKIFEIPNFADVWTNPYLPTLNQITGMFMGYLTIVVFDIIILIVLVMTTAIVLARYIMIIFLAGVSPISVSSLTFPQFERNKLLAPIFTNISFFDTWLEKLVKWLLVIPIFSILVILGNVVSQNVFNNTVVTSTGRFGGVVQFAVVLVVIAGWYLMAIRIAEKLSGTIGTSTKILTMAILTAIGGIALKGLASGIGMPLAGRAMQGAGWLLEKMPLTSRFRTTAGINAYGKNLRERGTEILGKSWEKVAQFQQGKMEEYLRNLSQTTDPQKRQDIINKQILPLVEKYKKNNFILNDVLKSLDKAPQQAVDQLFQNENFQKFISSPDLPQEAAEIIGKRMKGLSKETIGNMINDETLNILQTARQEILDGFIEGINNLNDGELMAKINQNIKNKTLKVQNIPSRLKSVLDKKTKGLFSALEQKNTESIVAAASQLSSEFYQDLDKFRYLLQQYKFTDNEISEIQRNIIEQNPENVIEEIFKTGDRDKYKFLIARLVKIGKTPEDVAQYFNIQKGSRTWRDLVRIWQIGTTLGTYQSPSPIP